MTSKRNRNAMPYAVVNFTGLMLICDESASSLQASWGVFNSVKIRLYATWSFYRLIQTTCIKLVDKRSWQSTCIETVNNLQLRSYHQAGESNANRFRYQPDIGTSTSPAAGFAAAWLYSGNSVLQGLYLLKRSMGVKLLHEPWDLYV